MKFAAIFVVPATAVLRDATADPNVGVEVNVNFPKNDDLSKDEIILSLQKELKKMGDANVRAEDEIKSLRETIKMLENDQDGLRTKINMLEICCGLLSDCKSQQKPKSFKQFVSNKELRQAVQNYTDEPARTAVEGHLRSIFRPILRFQG